MPASLTVGENRPERPFTAGRGGAATAMVAILVDYTSLRSNRACPEKDHEQTADSNSVARCRVAEIVSECRAGVEK